MKHACLRALITLVAPLSVAAQVSPYAGVWTGTTGQNLPVYFRITSQGVIDSLTIRLRVSFPTIPSSSCMATFQRDSGNAIQGTSFISRVALPPAITNIYSRVRSTFLSSTSAQGTYDRFSGSYFMYCGSTFNFGTGGTVLSQGTWQATKTGSLTAITEEQVPTAFKLFQNYPNPFNPSTVIEFTLPYDEVVRLTLYSPLGQELMTIVNERRSAGRHRVSFSAHNLSSGVYFYRLQTENNTGTKKLLLIK